MEIRDIVFVYELSEPRAMEWHGRYHHHHENEYEIHYFLQGTGSFRRRTSIQRVGAGTVVLCRPKEAHAIHSSDPSDPLSYYAILLRTGEGDGAVEDLLREKIDLHPVVKIGTNYRFFFEELKEKSQSGKPLLRQSAVHQLISFIYLLFDSMDRFHWGQGTNVHIERSLAIMQRHVFSDLTVQDLAGKIGLSPSYFIRLFTKKMRVSPKQYLMKLKIEAATALLISSGKPVWEIADLLHFSSEFHFSRCFKTSTGLPPRAYREQYSQITPDTLGTSAEPER